MINLEKMFKMACRDTRSDINEHLPTLLKYGKAVDHITEFGVRGGCSTLAWWCAEPKVLRCYDIAYCNAHDYLMSGIEGSDKFDYKFIQSYEQLGPFGEGNPEPIFIASNLDIVSTNRVKDHLSFKVKHNESLFHGNSPSTHFTPT